VSNKRTMSLRFPIALVLSIWCLTTPAWADFETGMGAYQRGNYATALSEWRPLAEDGDAQAQLHLGLLYANGNGVSQDYTKARQWYKKAAVQGYAMAQANLGNLYADGKGVPKDEIKGAEWIRKAAEQRDPNGQVSLGDMYRDGRGVPQDYIQALMWYNLGAANGAKLGAALRDALAKQMTPDQIAEAQKLAQDWRPKAK
jgi:TPR repeat protein